MNTGKQDATGTELPKSGRSWRERGMTLTEIISTRRLSSRCCQMSSGWQGWILAAEKAITPFCCRRAVPLEAKEGLQDFKVPRCTRTLSQWLNLLIDQGLVLENIEEPHPNDETVQEHPNIQDAQVAAYFLHVRARKGIVR